MRLTRPRKYLLKNILKQTENCESGEIYRLRFVKLLLRFIVCRCELFTNCLFNR